MSSSKTTTNPEPAPAVACEPAALTRDELQRHLATSMELFAATDEIRGLPDGWAVRMPDTPDTFSKLADFLMLNRLCCPQLRQRIVVEPRWGPIWLELTGPEGTKPALAAELVGVVRERVAMEAGLRPSGYPTWVDEVDALTRRELGLQFAQVHGELQLRDVQPFDAYSQNMTSAEFFETHVRPIGTGRARSPAA